MRHCSFLMVLLTVACVHSPASSGQSAPTGQDFIQAVAFAQHFALPAALQSENDRRLKATLLSALKEKSAAISHGEVRDLFDKQEFASWAADDQLTSARITELLAAEAPPSRREIFAETRQHLELLTTQFDMIDSSHQEVANDLARWIAKNYSSDKELGVTIICTGNSRRSMLGEVMGNLSAAYWGLPNVKFHSGGTAPSAFNSRTIRALQEVGVKVTATGQEAPRGAAGDANPIYQVLWGERAGVQEFSKLYSHAMNPQREFAAILVCDEADEACPTVDGAAVRISAPYFDPKAYDGTPLEAAKYAERRDDIGRMMLSALMQARRQRAAK